MYSKVLVIKCNDCGNVSDSIMEQITDWYDETLTFAPSCNECGSKSAVKWDGKCPICEDKMNDCGIDTCWD